MLFSIVHPLAPLLQMMLELGITVGPNRQPRMVRPSPESQIQSAAVVGPKEQPSTNAGPSSKSRQSAPEKLLLVMVLFDPERSLMQFPELRMNSQFVTVSGPIFGYRLRNVLSKRQVRSMRPSPLLK